MFDAMFGWFRRMFRPHTPYHDVSHQVYGVVMTQARRPAFYLDYGVPDTVMGRFDMLCLHLFLLTNRLARESGPAARSLGQEVFDRFADDIDSALREIGIGDTTVAKRKKQLIHGFYGQIEDFGRALDAGDEVALARKAGERFSRFGATVRAERLARYMIASRDGLLARPFGDIAAATFGWPDPEVTH